MDPAQVFEAMAAKGYPPGLTKELWSTLQHFPVRFWVVDNSGSMATADGARLMVDGAGSRRMLACTRWEELTETVTLAADLAATLDARTDFALLNPAEGVPQVQTVGFDAEGLPLPFGEAVELSELKANLARVSPSGTTPLTEAVLRVCSMVEPIAGQLRAKGQECVLTLATDGKPNDPVSFHRALTRLQLLPVWVVVRLCTDEKVVVKYWAKLDAKLELPLEVLEDERGEAKEVSRINPWLTYGQPLHIARMFELRNKTFDLLDESALVPTQLKSFCELLLGCDALPEPELDRPAFVAALERALACVPRVFDPLTFREQSWIKASRLFRRFSSDSCCLVS